MIDLNEYKTYVTEEYNTYVNEIKTRNFSLTELNAYKQRDFFYKRLKGIKAVEKWKEAQELKYSSFRAKDFDKYSKIMEKQEKIAEENLENAWYYLT